MNTSRLAAARATLRRAHEKGSARRALFICAAALAAAVACAPALAGAATLPAGFAETVVASGVPSPTAMAFAPDGRLFVCQQGGQLRVVKNGAMLPTPFVALTVNAVGERGLLGVAFDPDFATNRFLYLYYTTAAGPVHNRVSRFKASAANPDVALRRPDARRLPPLRQRRGATVNEGGWREMRGEGRGTDSSARTRRSDAPPSAVLIFCSSSTEPSARRVRSDCWTERADKGVAG